MSTERSGNIALGQWEIYWGWIVVIGAFLMLSLNYGARYSFGVFVKPMFSEYGWSMSVISLSASINILIYALSGVASGWLLDRMAPRWIMTFGTFITAAGFFLAGFISSPSGLYLSYGLLCGVGGAGIGLVVSSSSVGKWFREKQGLAMGIATMGIGFGTMALTPLAGFVSKNYGWRSGFMTLGAVILIVGFSVSQLLMRRTQPEDYGLLPDGLQCDSEKKSSKNTATDCERAGVKFSIISLMRRLPYWLIALFFGVEALVFMMAFVHQVAYAVTVGIEKVAAAASLGVIGIAGLCGRFFFGWLCDRIKNARLAALCGIIIMAVGMYVLSRTETASGLYLYALTFGFGYGSFAPLMPVLISEQFGRKVLGSAYGSINFFVMGIGGSLGPMAGGLIFDCFGSYASAWKFDMIILLLTSSLMLVLGRLTGSSMDSLK